MDEHEDDGHIFDVETDFAPINLIYNGKTGHLRKACNMHANIFAGDNTAIDEHIFHNNIVSNRTVLSTYQYIYYINIELIPIFFYQKLYINSSITAYKYPFTYTLYHMNRFQNIVIIFSPLHHNSAHPLI